MTLKLLAPAGAEVAANEMPEPRAVSGESLATDAASQLVRANRYAFSLFNGARDIVLDEMMFAGTEFLERGVAETAICNEFLSKLAQAHSVRNLGLMWQECTRHQLDFVRRDTERLLRHAERLVDNTARLLETWRQNGESLASDAVRPKK